MLLKKQNYMACVTGTSINHVGWDFMACTK